MVKLPTFIPADTSPNCTLVSDFRNFFNAINLD
jgi:hypothetical protein